MGIITVHEAGEELADHVKNESVLDAATMLPDINNLRILGLPGRSEITS